MHPTVTPSTTYAGFAIQQEQSPLKHTAVPTELDVMEIRQLQTFVIAAETESFTRTAETIGLTPSAVSQHVSALEKELGRSLFERGANSISLTEFGKSLHKRAQRLLEIADEIKLEAGQKTTEIVGTVKIACSSVPSEWLLPELLWKLRNAYPGIQESVKVSDSENAIAAVEAGDVDFALVGEFPRATHLCAKRIAEDTLVLVASPDHPLASGNALAPLQLLDYPLIFREPGSGSRRCVESKLGAAGVPVQELNIPIEVNSNDAIRAAVQRGLGISFLSRKTIEHELTEQRIVEVEIVGLKVARCLYLVTDPNRLPNQLTRAVLNLVDEYRKSETLSG